MRSFLSLLFLPLFLLSAEESVRVDYLSNTPVVYSIDVKILDKDKEIVQQKTHLILNKQGQSDLKKRFPLDVDLVLTSVSQKVIFNEKLNTFSKFQYAPLRLTLNHENQILDDQAKTKILNKLIQSVEPKLASETLTWIDQFFNYLFALPENDLYVGKKILVHPYNPSGTDDQIQEILRKKFSDHLVEEIDGQITEITKDEIKAKYYVHFSMVIDEEVIQFMKSLVDMDISDKFNFKNMKVEAIVLGKMSWNRKNAMLFQHECDTGINTHIEIEKPSESEGFRRITKDMNFKMKFSVGSQLLE